MSESITFTVPGDPKGKGRPRFGRTKSGAPVAFTDSQTAGYENRVALAAHQAMAGRKPLAEAVDLEVRIRMAPPLSASKAGRAAMLDGTFAPTKRPDLDNVFKAVADGLNGIAYTDDALVVGLICRKVYADTAGVDVVITPYSPERV
jgi:Holliday junction resolvase RusA-like endonuclease